MATLYITEFQYMAQVPNAGGQMPQQSPLVEQTVTISGTSAQSNAFNPKTAFIRLHTDAICSIDFGTNPTASVTSARMATNQTEYHGIPVGSSFKVAVISNT